MTRLRSLNGWMKRLVPLLALVLLPFPLRAQVTPAAPVRADTQALAGGETPVAAINGYFSGFASGDWARASSFVHPRTISALRELVEEEAQEDRTGQILQMMMGIRTMRELKALSDREVFSRFMSRQLSAAPAPVQPGALKVEVTNVAMESPDHARVTVVGRWGERAEPAQTFPVVRLDGRWFVLFDDHEEP